MSSSGKVRINKDKKTPVTQPSVRIQPIIQSKTDNPIVNVSKAKAEKQEASIGLKEVSPEIISGKWTKIIEVLKHNYPRDFNSIRSSKFELNGNQIVLHIKTENIKKSIEARLPILTKQAQIVLDNRNIRFVFEIEEEKEKEKSLYLTKDKVLHYKEQNKSLDKLIEVFNLDL